MQVYSYSYLFITSLLWEYTLPSNTQKFNPWLYPTNLQHSISHVTFLVLLKKKKGGEEEGKF